MLRLGYWLIATSGGLLAGYVAYFLILLLVAAPGIGIFFQGCGPPRGGWIDPHHCRADMGTTEGGSGCYW